MSAARHTPGPWEIGTNKEADIRQNVPIWGPDGQAVCWAEDRGGERRDNAQLIAAAPDLLAAAEAALDVLHYGSSIEAHVATVATLGAVIAKARGES